MRSWDEPVRGAKLTSHMKVSYRDLQDYLLQFDTEWLWTCKIWDSRSSVDEDSSVFRCDAMLSGK